MNELKEKRKIVTFQIDQELFKKLILLAKKEEVEASKIIRKSLKMYIESKNNN